MQTLQLRIDLKDKSYHNDQHDSNICYREKSEELQLLMKILNMMQISHTSRSFMNERQLL
jgi:hypothetical protein